MKWPKPKLLLSVLLVFTLPACGLIDSSSSQDESKNSEPGSSNDSNSSGPQLSANSELSFSKTPVNQQKSKALKLENVGTEVLNIRDLKVDGEDSFSLGSSEDSKVLEPGETTSIQVRFEPVSVGDAEATIYIFTNDPNNDPLKVTVDGTSFEPCVKVSVDEYIHFDSNPSVGETASKSIKVTNCSPVEIRLSTPKIEGKHADVFAVAESSLPDNSDDNGLKIGSDDQLTFKIEYTPTEEDRVDRADLKIEIVGPWEETQKRPILSQLCAVPKAFAKVDSSDSVDRTESRIEVNPPVNVRLIGQFSVNPLGEIQKYKWEVVQKPSRSNAEFTGSKTEDNTNFHVDVGGKYKLKLTVMGENEAENCSNESILTIDAQPSDISVDLTWNTPNDPDQTDKCGADLDLHYLHPDGDWKHSKWDVHHENKSPNWGADGGEDDPELARDDTDGNGLERIRHPNPMQDTDYRIGVYYNRADVPSPSRGQSNCPENPSEAYGNSNATITVYVEGEKVFEKTKELSEGDFWVVGDIQWPEGEVDEINELHDWFQDDINVQLTWNTPKDPDETNECGADLDLHYRHPNGKWKHPKWDIYFRNQTADWGASGVESDNPTMDIDDTDGSGPEIVSHNPAENELNYQVGVYYYRSEATPGFGGGCPSNEPDQYGASYATVRIFIDGELKFEKKNKYMAGTGSFWTVAYIKWPDGEVTAINETSDGYPNTAGDDGGF